jgi:hypothetical protein
MGLWIISVLDWKKIGVGILRVISMDLQVKSGLFSVVERNLAALIGFGTVCAIGVKV